MEDYPFVGQRADIGPYILRLSDWVHKLIPPVGWDIGMLDPYAYYITSGDAVQKADQLYRDAYVYAGKARSCLKRLKRRPTEEEVGFEKDCWKVAGGVHSMKIALERARGTAIFMETEWDRGRLLCIPKNPRLKNRSG